LTSEGPTPCVDRNFDREGFAVVRGLITAHEADLYASDLSIIFDRKQASASGKIGGVRNLLQESRLVSELATSARVTSVVESVTGLKLFAVRAICFDKTPESNWRVPWHQDLAIPVTERIETPGFSGWSVKDGVSHVLPPHGILEGMVTIRLHLDECAAENGALKVMPGSHRFGKLSADSMDELAKQNPVICEMGRGDALLMRPLLLHASSPSLEPSHRRVIHIEYASSELPGGLKWFGR
jgi:ectoine hydroxylase-related dioxygenase (phytanoyl-CoA dioxygenase family)